jgi:hypothetical protein
MSAIDDLARELRKRDNQEKIGLQVGRIVSVDPFVLEVGKLRAAGKNLKIAEHLLKDHRQHIFVEGSPLGDFIGYITLVEHTILAGDEVIVAASDNNQTFYILGKADPQG